MNPSSIHNIIDEEFLSGFAERIRKFGYTQRSKRFWGADISPNVFGCVGFTSYKGSTPLLINAIVGVRFEAIEKIYEQVITPLIPTQVKRGYLSKFSPTVSINMLKLRKNNNSLNTMLRINADNVDNLLDELYEIFRISGLSFIADNCVLKYASERMRPDRDGAAAVALRLPIMLFVLGRDSEALLTMEVASSWEAPLGDYNAYRMLVTEWFKVMPDRISLTIPNA